LPTYLLVAQMLISVALVTAVLFQLHGGGMGGIFGQADSVYRTRRGIESTLFKLTVVLVILLVIFAVLIVSWS